MMDEKAKEARRAYKREWNRRNPDKVKEYQARYWARKAARMAQEPPAETDEAETET